MDMVCYVSDHVLLVYFFQSEYQNTGGQSTGPCLAQSIIPGGWARPTYVATISK